MLRRCACLWIVLLLGSMLTTASSCGGQQREMQDSGAAEPASQESTATFHLRTFVNRIQIPTLVLTNGGKPASKLDSQSFSISLDSGPAFHPTRTRVEGDDPISLAVLIDAGGSQPELLASLAEDLAALSPELLHAEDNISIYAADCKMFRTRLNVPAQPDAIRPGVQQAFAALQPKAEPRHVHCSEHMHLWDWALYMFHQMEHAPGRRVALIISGGHEQDSNASLLQASRFAGHRAISVFGLRERAELEAPRSTAAEIAAHNRGEDRFELLCATNGGVVLYADPQEERSTLRDFLHMVRSRYILEFPRPDEGSPGLHEIVVTVPENKRFLVHPSGTSVIPSEQGLKDDPNVLPSQSSPAVFGKRRPMDATKR